MFNPVQSLNKKALISLFLIIFPVLLALSGRTLLAQADEQPSGPITLESQNFIIGHVYLVEIDLEVDQAKNDLVRTPVQNARVVARRLDQEGLMETLSGEDGSYELDLSSGLWSISVSPTDGSDPSNWVYPRSAKLVRLHDQDGDERKEVNFLVVKARSAVSGTITLPDGELPEFRVTVGLRNGEGVGAEFVTEPGDGSFKIMVPAGNYDLNIHPLSDIHAGPELDPILVKPNSELDLGEIKLISVSAQINGKITDGDGNGVQGIPVAAWHRGRTSVIKTRTAEDGTYSLKLAEGKWHVQPALQPNQPDLYFGNGLTVKLEAEQTVDNIDFELVSADSTIAGVLVNDGDIVINDTEGWVTAQAVDRPELISGSPIRNGEFAINVPSGTYTLHFTFAPGSPYFAPDDIEASVASGQTTSLRVPVREIEESIVGALVDPRTDQETVTGVRGVVGAWQANRWATTSIDPETGTYELEVADGIWYLDYLIDPENYVKLGGAQTVTVPDKETVRVPLYVTAKDAGISGTVLDPDGNPLAGAAVILDGLTAEVEDLWLHTRTDENGNYRIALPYGRYRVCAVAINGDWINPVEQLVSISQNEVAEGVNLQFLAPNAVINGRISIPGATEASEVLIYAWNERGGFNWMTADVGVSEDGLVSGDYSITVVSGTTWHVGAIFEEDFAFWTAAGRVNIREGAETAILNLTLNGPRTLPSPVVVTFDASEPHRIELSDGTAIFVPAGAIPVEGEVTLRIDPTARLPHQHHARLTTYGYAIHATDADGRPIEETFNHNVLIEFPIDVENLQGGLRNLKPAYFSTTTNRWTAPERYTVDAEEGVVKMAIDHFTNFAVTTGETEMIFLPMVTR
ncbi:MAG: carboxypeptidase-like regulatory domain-containing protein [Chloroflexota bacterium]